MICQYDACDHISDFCHQQLLRKMRRNISWTDGRTDGRADGQTDRGKTVYFPPSSGSRVYLDMCCIVCFTIHPYVMASRFRLCRDFYLQATNHQSAYLLKLDARQDMLINWSLTFNGISFSVM